MCVGLVTTTRVTHASPGGVFAKVANRHWENDAEVLLSGYDPVRCPDITQQLVHSHPGSQFKVSSLDTFFDICRPSVTRNIVFLHSFSGNSGRRPSRIHTVDCCRRRGGLRIENGRTQSY